VDACEIEDDIICCVFDPLAYDYEIKIPGALYSLLATLSSRPTKYL